MRLLRTGEQLVGIRHGRPFKMGQDQFTIIRRMA
jgi:hypothetical protein